jgi:hypothetical protein
MYYLYISRTFSKLCKNVYGGMFWGSLSGSYEFCHLLGYSAVQSICEPTFRRNISPPTSGSKKVGLFLATCYHPGFLLGLFSTVKKEVILSSETSVYIRTTRRYIPEDGNIQLSGCMNYCEFPDYVSNYQVICGDSCESEMLRYPTSVTCSLSLENLMSKRLLMFVVKREVW